MSRNDWNAPPGAPVVAGEGRRAARSILISLLVGMLSLGAAWAGSGLVPAGDLTDPVDINTGIAASGSGESSSAGTVGSTAMSLTPGTFYAGAAKTSMRPRPAAFGGTWETDYDKCATLRPDENAPTGAQEAPNHVADFRVRWAENSNCIYMGGYGIGPMFPVSEWSDPYDLWVRSIAMSDGQDTLVMTLIDAVYWEAKYNSMCEGIEGGCGWFDLKTQLSEELGVPADSLMFASTHSHTAPDFIGGWGGVPRWYMKQITESIKDTVRAAVVSMRPAVLEVGETILRERNGERRDFYRSAEDDTFSWFRLIDASDQPTPETCTTPAPESSPGNNGSGGGNGFGNTGKEPAPAPTPICSGGSKGSAIATVGAYAAHPVTEDECIKDADDLCVGGQADADFPAVFAKTVEDRFGRDGDGDGTVDSVGAFFQTGLGNMSPRGNKVQMGEGMASYIPDIGAGRRIEAPDVAVREARWDQPVTNIPLGTLGVTGFFDRTFNQTPAQVSVGKGPFNTRCHSASPISVNTGVTAAKVGPLWLTGGPGELFSNITNTIEERNPGGVTMALGLVNDGLGYIIQSFETDHVGRQGVGFVGGGEAPDEWKEGEIGGQGTPEQTHAVGASEYEDAYSIDHCFGDMTLEKTLGLLGQI